jgi:hypothetical protein
MEIQIIPAYGSNGIRKNRITIYSKYKEPSPGVAFFIKEVKVKVEVEVKVKEIEIH